jgi:hypothetical protein
MILFLALEMVMCIAGTEQKREKSEYGDGNGGEKGERRWWGKNKKVKEEQVNRKVPLGLRSFLLVLASGKDYITHVTQYIITDLNVPTR